MRSENDIDVSARLTIYAFLLEIVVANWMRATAHPEKTLAQLRGEFLEALRYNTSVPRQTGPDTNIDVAIHAAAVAYAERFFDRLDERVKDLTR